MQDILMWIGAFLMVLGLLCYGLGLYLFFDGLGLFMVGSVWDIVMMLIIKSGLLGGDGE